MKKITCIKRASLLFATALTACASAWAYDFKVDGICYNVTTVDSEVEVTFEDTNYNSYSGSVTIPSTVENDGTVYIVSSIGDDAFEACQLLNEVTIGDNVTTIGYYAFYQCTALEEITIPQSVTDIGWHAFEGCTALEKATIGNGVDYIGWYAFYQCTALASVSIGRSVTSIGNYAFGDCSALTKVTIPNNVSYIANDAFYRCSSLSSLSIGTGVVSIGTYAFYQCVSLSEVIIPDGVNTIGEYAFCGCSSLVSLTLGEGVSTIENYAFSCSSLAQITLLGDNPPAITSSTFDAVDKDNCLLIVPIGSYAAYSAADNWKEFLNIEEVVELLVDEASDVTSSSATLTGQVIFGTEKPLAQGFEYWTSDDDIQDITADIDDEGNMTLDLTDLEADTDYTFTAFAITQSGTLYYGDILSFTTEIAGIGEITADHSGATEVSRYDITGRELATPQTGVNIVRYSDGTVEKVIVK